MVDTDLGRIGMIICFDGDYPELCRIQGAEIIARPSALLRSADIAEMTSRAPACDNHVYVIVANSTGTDPAGVHYFGKSHIADPTSAVTPTIWRRRLRRPSRSRVRTGPTTVRRDARPEKGSRTTTVDKRSARRGGLVVQPTVKKSASKIGGVAGEVRGRAVPPHRHRAVLTVLS